MLCLAVQSGINGKQFMADKLRLGQKLTCIKIAFYFDLRTRGLANIVFWAIQLPSAYGLTLVLDNKNVERRVRGIMGITLTVTIALAGWICQSVWVNQDIQINRQLPGPAVDWTDKRTFGLPFAIYVLFGIVYATWQICCQW
jgi:hypothetical protein